MRHPGRGVFFWDGQCGSCSFLLCPAAVGAFWGTAGGLVWEVPERCSLRVASALGTAGLALSFLSFCLIQG